MAVSAFKSSSRKNNLTNPSSSSTTNNGRPNPDLSSKKSQTAIRRSRSVSAFSRASSEASTAEDFLNKRDNPLFWANSSPPDLETPAAPSIAPSNGVVSGDNRRGRSVARNGDGLGGRKEVVGRSLSTVDSGRRNRSVSRAPVSRSRYVNSEVWCLFPEKIWLLFWVFFWF